jgi:hypothetical protein
MQDQKEITIKHQESDIVLKSHILLAIYLIKKINETHTKNQKLK